MLKWRVISGADSGDSRLIFRRPSELVVGRAVVSEVRGLERDGCWMFPLAGEEGGKSVV